MNKKMFKFNTKGNPTITEVGGKAKNLIEMMKAGFPVPDGFVLTTSFFGEWTKEIKCKQTWKEFLSSPTQENCERVKAQAKVIVFSSRQREILENAKAELKDTELFAVRSSSPEEDLSSTSFAGMYKTILGVRPKDLEENIKEAFSSMLDFRVIEYKIQNKIPLENTEICVIVQKQINSDTSGIGFSINPLNNCYDEAVINSSFGLGESIVSGTITPDSFTIEKNTGVILEKNLGTKETKLQITDSRHIEEIRNMDSESYSLADNQILEISGLIKRCENHYGFPVDIEWAYEGENLYLLQVRPITTYFKMIPEMVTKPGERKKLYMDLIGMSQGFSDPLSVLGADIWATVLERLKQGTTPSGHDGFLINVAGRQYFLLHNVFKAMGKKVGFSIVNSFSNIFENDEDEIFKEYVTKKSTKKLNTTRLAYLKVAFRMLPNMVRTFFNPQRQIESFEENIDGLMRKFKSIKNDKPLDEIVNNAFDEFDKIATTFSAIYAGLFAQWRLNKMMKGTPCEKLVDSLLMDVPSNPTSAMGHKLFELANSPEIIAIENSDKFVSKIKQRAFSEEFMRIYDEYMYRYGERGFKEIDISSKRTVENLDTFFKQLKSVNLKENQLLKVTQHKEESLEKMREVAKGKGKLKKFEKYVWMINKAYGHRETPKYLMVVLNGTLRKLALEIGDQFVSEKRLINNKEIFDLTLSQIGDAQRDEKVNLRSIIEKNLKPYELYKNRKSFPNFFNSRGKILNKAITPKNGDYSGIAVSAGVIRGRAKVLNTPYEKPLEPGEILVTVATEPSWTPVFVNASGVVLEVGAGLQHGAIIAREYGLPCVSGLTGITKIIEDGDIIEVDGTNGIVRILEQKEQES